MDGWMDEIHIYIYTYIPFSGTPSDSSEYSGDVYRRVCRQPPFWAAAAAAAAAHLRLRQAEFQRAKSFFYFLKKQKNKLDRSTHTHILEQ